MSNTPISTTLYGPVKYADQTYSQANFYLNAYEVDASTTNFYWNTQPNALTDKSTHAVTLGGYLGGTAGIYEYAGALFAYGSDGTDAKIINNPWYRHGYAPRFFPTGPNNPNSVSTTSIELDVPIVNDWSHEWQNDNAGMLDNTTPRQNADHNRKLVGDTLFQTITAFVTQDNNAIETATVKQYANGVWPIRGVTLNTVYMSDQADAKITNLGNETVTMSNDHVYTWKSNPPDAMNWAVIDFEMQNPVSPYNLNPSGVTPPLWVNPDNQTGGSGTAKACAGTGINGLGDATKCKNYLTWFYNNLDNGFNAGADVNAATATWNTLIAPLDRPVVVDGALSSPTSQTSLYHRAGAQLPLTAGCVNIGGEQYQCNLTQQPISIEGKTVYPDPAIQWVNPFTYTFITTTIPASEGCTWNTSNASGQPTFPNNGYPCPKLLPVAMYSTTPVWVWENVWAWFNKIGIDKTRMTWLAALNIPVFLYARSKTSYPPLAVNAAFSAVGLLAMIATSPLGSPTAAFEKIYNAVATLYTTAYVNYQQAVDNADTQLTKFVQHALGYAAITGIGFTLSIVAPSLLVSSMPTSMQAMTRSDVTIVSIFGVLITLGVDFVYSVLNGDFGDLLNMTWNAYWNHEQSELCKLFGATC